MTGNAWVNNVIFSKRIWFDWPSFHPHVSTREQMQKIVRTRRHMAFRDAEGPCHHSTARFQIADGETPSRYGG